MLAERPHVDGRKPGPEVQNNLLQMKIKKQTQPRKKGEAGFTAEFSFQKYFINTCLIKID